MEGREMIVCTKCGRQAERGETFCGGCGAFLEWAGEAVTPAEAPPPVVPVAQPARPASVEREIAGPPVVATLTAGRVDVEPGAKASVTVEVRCRGRTVDQLSVEVGGSTAAWASVEPARLNLLPGMSGESTISFRPPRGPAVRAGSYSADVTIRSSEHPDTVIVERVTVAIGPFVELETALVPSVLRGDRAASATLRASNKGNAPVDLSIAAEDPELAFAFRIAPDTLRVDPGVTLEATITVTPRQPLQAGPERTRPFRVLVAAQDGPRRSHEATFVQVPLPAPPPRPVAEVVGPLVNLSATGVRVEPGGQAGVAVQVLNRGRTADQLALAIRGPAAPWTSVEPARLNVLPNAWAGATIVCWPPRTPAMRPGAYEGGLAVESREHPAASVIERFVVEVVPFVELEASLAPSVLRGAQGATARLRVANGGSAPVELTLAAEDPEMALDFRFSPSKLRVAPGQAAEASVAVRSRRALRPGPDLTLPFRIIVGAGAGWRKAVDGQLIQAAPRRSRTWPKVLALLGLVGVIALFVASWHPPAPGPPSGPTPFASEVAPAASVAIGPDIGGRYYLDPGNSRIIIITPVGQNLFTIEEQLPALWPFKGTLEWVEGDRFEGPATLASGSTFRVEIERQPDGRLVTRFVYITDDQGNPIIRTDPHELVPLT